MTEESKEQTVQLSMVIEPQVAGAICEAIQIFTEDEGAQSEEYSMAMLVLGPSEVHGYNDHRRCSSVLQR